MLIFLCLLLISEVHPIQEGTKDGVQVIGPAQCLDYGAVLDAVAQNAPADLLIRVVARLGEGDTRSDLNKRRLHNVRTYWTEFRSDKLPRESITLIEGERVRDYGRLEIYVGDKLTTMLKLKSNLDLIVGNCYPEPVWVPLCNVKENRKVYPCLDRKDRRKKRL